MPQLTIAVKRHSVVKDFKCDAKDCSKIKSNLETSFASKILRFESVTFWDQPSAYRLIGGLMRTVNEYSKQISSTVFINFNE